MKLRMYTIYDSVAEESGPIYCVKNDGVALRAFQQAMSGKDRAVWGEFALMYLGTFDNVTMALDPVDLAQVVETTLSTGTGKE